MYFDELLDAIKNELIKLGYDPEVEISKMAEYEEEEAQRWAELDGHVK